MTFGTKPWGQLPIDSCREGGGLPSEAGFTHALVDDIRQAPHTERLDLVVGEHEIEARVTLGGFAQRRPLEPNRFGFLGDGVLGIPSGAEPHLPGADRLSLATTVRRVSLTQPDPGVCAARRMQITTRGCLCKP